MKINETVSLTLAKVNGNIVEGVKVLGLESRNGRSYLREAVKKALPKYEGKWVYIDHRLLSASLPPGSTEQPRGIAEKFARIINARIDETGGIRSDLKFNPRHPFCQIFLGWLETDTEALGLSHSVEGLMRRDTTTNKDIVYEITDVESVDIVSEPATTKSILESMNPNAMMPTDDGYAAKVGEVIQAIMMDKELDDKAKKANVLTLLNLMDDEIPADEEMDKDAPVDEEKPVDAEKPVDEEADKDAKKPQDEEESDDNFKKKEEALFKKFDDKMTEMVIKLEQKFKLLEDKKPISLPPANPKSGKPISVDDFVSNLHKGK